MLGKGDQGGSLVCGSPPPGWIYINDEISDGLVSMSQLTCLSSYNCENVFNIGDPADDRIEYPLVNGELDNAAISVDWPSSTGGRFYNQLNLADGFHGDINGWDGSKLGIGDNYDPNVSSVPNTTPYTIAMVLEDMDADLGDSYFLFFGGGMRLQYSVNTLFFQLNGGSFMRKSYTGLNLYINDMTTPITGTDAGSATIGAGVFDRANFMTNDTIKSEMFVFTRELNLSERGTLKSFFEQRYTFS
jgi:hypothetical protein